MKLEIRSIKKTQVEGNKEIEKIRNSNSNHRDKPHKQNKRDG